MVLDVATINVSLPGVDLYVNKVSVAIVTSLDMHIRILTPLAGAAPGVWVKAAYVG